MTSVERAFHRARTWLAGWFAGLRHLSDHLSTQIRISAVLLSIVPGLGHPLINRRLLGRCIFAVWFVFLLLTILSIATEWNWLFVGGMIATHAFAIITIFAKDLGYERLLVRSLFGFLLGLGLWALLYAPIGSLATRFYQPIPLNAGWHAADSDFITPDDCLLAQGTWLRPSVFQRGDLVAYAINGASAPGYRIEEGLGLDRIVGIPGDHVQVVDGALTVNDLTPSPAESPLGGVPGFVSFDVHLLEDQYVIFPTRLALILGAHPGQQQAPLALINAVSVVSYEDIHGRVLLRFRPFSRFGRLK